MDLLEQLKQDHHQLLQQMQEVLAIDLTGQINLLKPFDNLLFHFELEETFLLRQLESNHDILVLIERTSAAHEIIKQLVRGVYQGQLDTQALQGQVENFLASHESAHVQEAITELFQGASEQYKSQNQIQLLYEAVQRHFKDEETSLFPVIEERYSQAEQQAILTQIQREKSKRRQEQNV